MQHSGICINRTIVELKENCNTPYNNPCKFINRTIVELRANQVRYTKLDYAL